MDLLNGIYPQGAITLFQTVSGNITTTTVSGTEAKTILSVAMQQQKDLSDTILRCGTKPIAKNYGKDLPQVFMAEHCSDTINIVKTGNDEANVTMVYVPYDTRLIATTTPIDPTIPSVNVVSGGYVGATFYEWLFVAGVFLFFLSFLTWGKIHFFTVKK